MHKGLYILFVVILARHKHVHVSVLRFVLLVVSISVTTTPSTSVLLDFSFVALTISLLDLILSCVAGAGQRSDPGEGGKQPTCGSAGKQLQPKGCGSSREC